MGWPLTNRENCSGALEILPAVPVVAQIRSLFPRQWRTISRVGNRAPGSAGETLESASERKDAICLTMFVHSVQEYSSIVNQVGLAAGKFEKPWTSRDEKIRGRLRCVWPRDDVPDLLTASG